MTPLTLHLLWLLALLSTTLATQLRDYNEKLAFKYLAHSAVAYCHPDNITQWDCPLCQSVMPGFKPYKTFQNKNDEIFGYIGTYNYPYTPYDTEIVIAFRGTNPSYWANWWTDLEFPKTTSCFGLIGARCHEGFYKAYKSVRSQIEQSLGELYLAHKDAHITVTGHSLGGALALLAAFNTRTLLIPIKSENGTIQSYQQPDDVSAITFGSPRVGNRQFSETYDKLVPSTHRVVHDRDMIPHLPLQLMGFWHAGREVWYRCANDTYNEWCWGKWRDCDTSDEDDHCSDCNYVDASIDDHLYYFALRVGRQCKKPEYVVDLNTFPYM